MLESMAAVVQTMLKEGSVKWTGNARDKMKQLRKAIKSLDDDKGNSLAVSEKLK
jgi:hypothetical protein